MKIIEIDEEVYSYLQQNAIAYVETPNDTLRRLFGFGKEELPSRMTSLPPLGSRRREGRKMPKADLKKLVNACFLEEGQKLRLRDYQGREIPDSEATIHQGNLLKDGEIYSMSNLAQKLFKNQGYASDSVRGPVHWFTENNFSIKKLWEGYLKKIA